MQTPWNRVKKAGRVQMTDCHGCTQEDLALHTASEAGASPLPWGWRKVMLTQPDGIPTHEHCMRGRGQTIQTVLKTSLCNQTASQTRRFHANWKKEKERMNIIIKCIKRNRSGQREQNIYETLWSQPQTHFLLHIWMCNKRTATISLRGQPRGAQRHMALLLQRDSTNRSQNIP